MRNFLMLTLVLALSNGCSSIRMNYEAEIETQKQGVPETKTVHYAASYELSPTPTLCGLTAIFLGGYCWFYLTMPTGNYTQAVKNDALKKLSSELKGGSYQVRDQRVFQKGWADEKEEFSIE